MKISIGSDHRGIELKTRIIKNFRNIEWIDVGTNSKERTDYPIFAKKVCENILQKDADFGILICASGIGMSIAANRFKNIYAALCWAPEIAKLAKEDDNANVLVLPSDFVQGKLVYDIINEWLYAEFKKGHYQKRIDLIDR